MCGLVSGLWTGENFIPFAYSHIQAAPPQYSHTSHSANGSACRVQGDYDGAAASGYYAVLRITFLFCEYYGPALNVLMILRAD